MPYLYYCCIDFDEIWWKDAEDQIFSRYRVQQRALSSKKKICDFLWKFWPKHPLPGYPKKFLRDGTTRVLFSIKNCTDLDRYQKFCQQSRDHSITLKTKNDVSHDGNKRGERKNERENEEGAAAEGAVHLSQQEDAPHEKKMGTRRLGEQQECGSNLSNY